RVDEVTGAVQFTEPEPLDGQLLLHVETDCAAIILNLDSVSCCLLLTDFRCFRGCHDYPMISSRVLSRSRATSRGSLRLFKPSNVALITLWGFELPIDFVRIFETPAACITARTAPPAMIPVP